MTFKGMLKILITEHRKQHEHKMVSLVQELIKTQRELRQVKEQLRAMQSSENSTIPLFVQYNGFFNELCDIHQTITIKELLSQLRRLTGIENNRSIQLRVLSEDGLRTQFILPDELDQTLEEYKSCLKARMILCVEDLDDSLDQSLSTTSSTKTHSFDESDV